jgi:hypothetical protein
MIDMEIVNNLYGKCCLILPHRQYDLLTGEFRSDKQSPIPALQRRPGRRQARVWDVPAKSHHPNSRAGSFARRSSPPARPFSRFERPTTSSPTSNVSISLRPIVLTSDSFSSRLSETFLIQMILTHHGYECALPIQVSYGPCTCPMGTNVTDANSLNAVMSTNLGERV